MTDLPLRFEFEPGTDLNAAALVIRERLEALDVVAAVDARPEDARITGLEIAAAIAVGVQIIQGTQKLVSGVRRLITDVKGLRGDIAGLRTIALDAGPKAIALDDVTDKDIEQLIDETDSSEN